MHLFKHLYIPSQSPSMVSRAPRTPRADHRLHRLAAVFAVAAIVAVVAGCQRQPEVAEPAVPTATSLYPVYALKPGAEPSATPEAASTPGAVPLPTSPIPTFGTPLPAYAQQLAETLRAFEAEQRRLWAAGGAPPAGSSGGTRSGSARSSAPAPSAYWRGQYYAAKSPGANLVMTRNDPEINFEWGLNAPGPGVPADTFSVRWERSVGFEAAFYRFHAATDDGVRISVDGKSVLNAFSEGPKDEQKDVGMAAGTHTVRVDYWENAGNAYAKVWWEKVDNPELTGWKGEYFSNDSLSGSPVLLRDDKTIVFNWGTRAPDPALPADGFSVRWTQRVDFDDGRYEFSANADDGLRAWIGDDQIFDHWGPNDGSQTWTKEKTIRGKKDVRVEYFDGYDNARVKFSWRKISDAPTRTPTPTGTVTEVPTGSATPTPLATTPTPPTATPTASATPSATSMATETETPAPTPTATPASTETETPSATETETPAATETETPAATATETPVFARPGAEKGYGRGRRRPDGIF